MFVTNRVTGDPRVRREAAALTAAGHEVVVLGVAETARDAPYEEQAGVTVRRAARPTVVRRVTLPRVSPRAWLDAARDGALRWLSASHPEAYGALRDAYVNVRHGGALPPDILAAAAANAAAAAAELDPARAPTPAAPVVAGSERAPTRRERLEQDLDALGAILLLNVRFARLAVAERADVYHAHDLDTLLAGALASRLTGARLVYDFHELYTHQHPEGVKSALWRGYYDLLERRLIGEADALITVNDSLARWNARAYGAPRALTLLNVPALQAPPPPTLRPGEPRTVLYHGGYSPHRGLETLVESARHLRGARLVMRGVGAFERDLRALVARLGVGDRVTFAPPVGMTELVRSAQDADVGVVPYLPVCLNNYYSLPNKLFEYLMAGLAVVATDAPELRRVIDAHEVGAVYDPRDPRSLASAINGLVADDDRLQAARRAAVRAATTTFNWEAEQVKLLGLYDDLLSRPRRGSGSARAGGRPLPA